MIVRCSPTQIRSGLSLLEVLVSLAIFLLSLGIVYCGVVIAG